MICVRLCELSVSLWVRMCVMVDLFLDEEPMCANEVALTMFTVRHNMSTKSGYSDNLQ